MKINNEFSQRGKSLFKNQSHNLFPLVISSGAFFLSYYTRLMWSILSVYMPLKPTITQDGHIFALYFFGYVAVQIPAGFVSDRFDCGKIISLSLILLSIITFFSGVATNIYQEYVLSLLMGFCAGWIYPASLKIIEYYYKDNRSVFMGYYSIAWPLAIVLSGIVLPVLSVTLGWRFGYYSSAILCAIVGILSFGLKSYKTSSKMNLKIIKNKNVLLISFGGLLFFASYWSITLYAYKYFLDIGINKVTAGIMFSSMAIAGFFSSPVSGFIIKKFGISRTIFLSFFSYALLTLFLAIIKIEFILFLIAFGMGFARFIITPVNNDLLMRIGKQDAGAVSGFSNMFWQTSGILSPLFSSFIISKFGFSILWVTLCAIILIASTFYLKIKT